jgi:hypothetical protein
MNGGNVTEKPSKAVIRIKLTDKVDGCEFQEEAYSLNIEPSQLTIQATTLQGLTGLYRPSISWQKVIRGKYRHAPLPTGRPFPYVATCTTSDEVI